jgi:CRISPR-associated protein Cas1
MLKGRLGLELARLPHELRHGLVYLDRGRLEVEDGCLRFLCAGGGGLAAGDWQVPHQSVSLILLGPGSSVTHDALRLLARHNTGLAAVGGDGVRFYTAPPLLPDASDLARRQARAWADEAVRIQLARRMYAWRLGEIVPADSLDVLRGIEGSRMKESYRLLAEQIGVPWHGRRYDRADPNAADVPNQAINHAASAVEAAAAVACACAGAIPQLGFIHEDSGQAFVLDVADLVRTTVTIPVAFRAAKAHLRGSPLSLEAGVRREAAAAFRTARVIPTLIERVKSLFQLD